MNIFFSGCVNRYIDRRKIDEDERTRRRPHKNWGKKNMET